VRRQRLSVWQGDGGEWAPEAGDVYGEVLQYEADVREVRGKFNQ
jgi:hypothetical protein